MSLTLVYSREGRELDIALSALPTNSMVEKFLGVFLEDQSALDMESAVRDRRWGDVHASSHTLKGLALNMGFTALSDRVSALCELTRNHTNDEEFDQKSIEKAEAMLGSSMVEYRQIIEDIKR